MQDWLWQGLLFSIAGIVVSLIVSHIYYRKSIKAKEPLWCIWTATMADTFTSNEEDLHLSFNGLKINSLSVSWVMIWNNGREALEKNSVSAVNPLRIVATRRASILEATVVAQSDTGNQASVRLSGDDAAVIDFDYLNYRQGLIVSVVHTGASPRFLSVSGGVINGEPPRQIDVDRGQVRGLPAAAASDEVFGMQKHIGALLTFWGWGLLILVGVVVAIGLFDSWNDAIGVALLGGLLILVPGGIAAGLVQAVFGYRLPIGLDDLDDIRVLPEFWDRWVKPRPPLFM